MARLIRLEQGKQLAFLLEQPEEVLIEFCKLAIEYINAGVNDKKCTVAAKKLSTTYETVRGALEALVALLIDSTKLAIAEREFYAAIASLDSINEKQSEILWQFVISKRNLVDNVLRASCQDELYFRELEWRIEGRIASRRQRSQASPVIKMKFHLDKECVSEYREKLGASSPDRDTTESSKNSDRTRREVLAETDPIMLQHMIQVLEQALLDARTRRVRNYVKPTQS
ncbi:COMM domain-containing protein 2 [Anopheles ziemanni]|uniref:COMM domain-containing protein 2 n=1 Tax=Anopheles coustani TaxID=139045 RepID=UPI002659E034|nr:COMM domain-containing protein 2 [Anopheles coustani]XP_058172073.1 COMM domain-containing protein 2 [Anopheles ziemanni]